MDFCLVSQFECPGHLVGNRSLPIVHRPNSCFAVPVTDLTFGPRDSA